MKKIISLSLLIVSILLLGSLSVHAEGEASTPKIYANDVSVTAGNSFYVYVYASGLESVGALELYAFYDTDQFTLLSSYASGISSGAQTTINTSVAGEASFSLISATGINGSGTLWTIRFQAKSDLPKGTYNINLAVGNAYDTSLSPIECSTTSPKINVSSSTVSRNTLSLYPSGSNYTVYNGDSVTVNFAANNAYGMAAADFEIDYDPDLLLFESVSLGYKLTSAQNAIYSTNSKIPGYLKISYAATSGITGSVSPIVSVTFKVVADTNTATEIKLKATNVSDEDLVSINGGTATRYLTISKRQEAPSLPKITTSGFDGTNENFDIILTAPGDSGLAAIDFEISFDPEKIACTSAICEADNCFVVSKINNENGTVKFSFICENGITSNTELIKLSFTRSGLAGGEVTLTVRGKNAVDSNYNSLQFEYESALLLCHVLGAAPTCIDPQICTICAKQFAEPLGHDEQMHEAKAPTCTSIGWDAYVTCSRCDYNTYNELEVLPHNTVTHDAKAATCTEIGWNEYETCQNDNCDYSSYSEIPALGHRVLVGAKVWVDSVALQNDAYYPFEYIDGVYKSTNKSHNTDSTFTFIALYDCTLDLSYYVSSEKNFDKIFIRVNGNSWVENSGIVSWTGISISLKANDVVTVVYHKDVSVSTYEDTAGFRFTCTQTEVDERIAVPAENAQPTCTEAVICHFCQVVVKNALGHNFVDYVSDNNATCVNDGTKTAQCERCTATNTIFDTGSAFGHTTVVDEAIASTCTNTGLSAGSHCSVCNLVFVAQVETPKKPHTYDDKYDAICNVCGFERDAECAHINTETLSKVDATCEASGLTEGKKCLDCEAILIEQRLIDALGHNLTHHNAKAPTCTEGGWSAYDTCSRCNYNTRVNIAATGHTTVVDSAIAPDCTSTGLTEGSHCTVCNAVFVAQNVVDALGHNLTHYNAKAPTCTEGGWSAYDTCSRCDYNTKVNIAATGHTTVVDSAVAPDCTSTGLTEGSHCSSCGVVFVAQTVIDALGHSYGDWYEVTAPTCTEDGYERRDCSRCSHYETSLLERTGHTTVVDEAIASTCTKTGLTEGLHCSACGKTLIVQSQTPMKPHAYDDKYDAICNVCGFERDAECAHINTEILPKVDATCETSGLTEGKKCLGCEALLIEQEFIDALGHNLTHHNAKSPTCTEGGWSAYDTCSRCDYNTKVNIAATGHTTVVDSAVAPDCTSTGLTEGSHCSSCGVVFVAQTVIDALGHSYGDWYEVTAPTCTADGQQRRDCSRCSHYETSLLERNGHTTVVDEAIASTCTNTGLSEGSHCSVCNLVFVAQVETPKKPHTYDDKYDAICNVCGFERDAECAHINTETLSKVDATCEASGLTEGKKCLDCEEILIEQEFIDALGHNLTHYNAKSPTCTEGGWSAYDTCSRCDYNTRVNIAATGHTTVIDSAVAPDCTSTGLTEGSHCTVCNAVLVAQNVVDALGHSLGNWYEVTAPTCTADGQQRRDCSRCSHYETNLLERNGHTTVVDEAIASTCTKTGLTEGSHCSVCNAVLIAQIETPKKSHTYDNKYDAICNVCGFERDAECAHINTETLPKVDATCEASGLTEGKRCLDCEELLVEQTVVNAFGHRFDEWFEFIPPTCTEDGLEMRNCSICACSESRVIEKLEHSYTTVVVIPPTCTEDGYTIHYCNCGDSYVSDETKATGHNYSSEVTVQPTYETTGIRTYTCSGCGDSYTEVIPAITCEHNYNSVVTAPTCTAQGYTTYTCSECGDSYIDNYTAKTEHIWGDGVVTVAPMCTVDGVRTFTCSCGATRTESEKATGHDYADVITAPTCTAQGYTTYTCHCGDSYVDFYVDALGHTWDDGVIMVQPTTTAKGEKLFTCIDCGIENIEEIPMLEQEIGDIDGEEGVSSNDAVYLLMHTFFPEEYPVSQECDIDGDGEVSSSDAVYLLMHTFFPEEYPLMPANSTPQVATSKRKEDEE